MIFRFQIGVFSVIYDAQNRILFNHRRDLDLWDLPGGGMNHGELPTDTAIRETKEETGFDIAIDRLVMIYSKPPPQDDDLIFIYSGHITGGVATTSDESDDVRFFATNEFPENISPRKKHILEVALQNLPETVYKQVNLPKDIEWLESWQEQKKEISRNANK